MNLFIAKETVLIFAHEIDCNGFSTLVDQQQKNISRITTSNEEVNPLRVSGRITDSNHCRHSYYKINTKVKLIAENLTFVLVVLLALIPPKMLLNCWSITCTVACPLIATVLPGFFYYTQAGLNHDKDEKSKQKKCYGLIYSIVGILFLPSFLMLTIYTIQN